MVSLKGRIIELARRAYLKFYLNPWIKRMITNQFHKLYYYTPVPQRTWHQTYWLGVPLQKCPFDLWVYQEIIEELQPDIIVECGTGAGGSALFLASICELVGRGRVVSIDIEECAGRPKHERISYLIGSSISPSVLDRVRAMIGTNDRVLVVLDSDHTMSHVLKEMQLFGSLVTPGSYLIVEDTNINGHPVAPEFGPGPLEAVEAFLKDHHEFIINRGRQKFYLSFNPNGYLKKIK